MHHLPNADENPKTERAMTRSIQNRFILKDRIKSEVSMEKVSLGVLALFVNRLVPATRSGLFSELGAGSSADVVTQSH